MTQPTGSTPVFHITHWKAGSQWVQGVLRRACPERFLVPTAQMQAGQIPDPASSAAVYSPLYMPREKFEASPAASIPHRKFIVIRDIRDALVSWYFSLRYTHNANPTVAGHRVQLEKLGDEEGLLYLVEHRDYLGLVNIPLSWLGAPDPVIRYEAMVQEPHSWFERIFEHCGLPGDRRHAAVEHWLFENKARRPRGQELRTAHMRKGIAGDWKNHFTPRITEAFKRKYGEAIIRLGYESSADW